MERFLAQLAKMNVPHYISGDADALLKHLPLSLGREMIDAALQSLRPVTNAAPPQPLETTPDTQRAGQLPVGESAYPPDPSEADDAVAEEATKYSDGENRPPPSEL